MRATPLAVTALAAALLLTACDSGGSDDNGGGGSGGGGGAKKGGSACAIGTMGVEVGPADVAPAIGDTGNVPVSLTNQSAPCTLEGVPGVTLQGSTSVLVGAAPGSRAEKLTLAKGESATFTLTYVKGGGADGKSLAATTLRIGLPGTGDTKSFPWKYGAVALKGGKPDVPDASVGPFTRAGD
ncbi:hypothetical protein SLINC_4732 [Streptomyces lincolnensis]|uniref:Uncharacterized protein n=1 Tax=Streptomyces lincolnensis TaxID=1915 RepID=A0A1B1MEB8_STRLN|nr:DUF4232 domain-containing protein [Streptomyces lincolnensis]ANS66956.1 hypothetical protein SLINC_4732 [Streptomyces lincolnensis]AXG55828.1 hypothetical protein SLCG_4673 [Streptomyces lincolnensis]QMV07689.1 DUF4232 domain-containing protein [Streptomyces lincolnensis]